MKSITGICISLLLLLTGIIPSGIAEMENKGELHQYLEIPFESATPDAVSQILQKETGEGNPDQYGFYQITDFGYMWDLHVDFDEDQKSVNRVYLVRPESGWGESSEFEEKVQKDILQFIDMEAQLTVLYGEPDDRFFYTNVSKYNANYLTRFMFPSGKWDAVQMMDVCKGDRYLVASSVWGNVELRVWVDWVNKKKFGYLTKLNLFFFDEAVFQSPKTIVEYPPELK